MLCQSDHAPMMRLVSAGAQRQIERQQQLPLGLGLPGPGRVVQQSCQRHVPAGPQDADRPASSAVDRGDAEALPHPGGDTAGAAAAGLAAVVTIVPSRQQGQEQQRQVGRLRVPPLHFRAGDVPCLGLTVGDFNSTCQYENDRLSPALAL